MEKRIAKAKAGSTKLNFYDCGLTSIPPQVFSLTHLTCLYIGKTDFGEGNNLTNIPEDISALTNLTYLNLHHNNQLSTLPDSISALSKLYRLSLYANHLTSIPQCITTLSNLKELCLNNNKLISIPQCISTLSNLTFLLLHNNPTLKYPPYSTIGGCYRNVVKGVKQFLSTHTDIYTRRGRRQHMWNVIRLMYIANKDPNCTSSFNMIPHEVIVVS